MAEQLPFTYTGADFYALCSDAMLKAVTRQATAVDARIAALNADPATRHPISTANFFDHHAAPEDIAVMVSEQDFLDANRELIPSVSAGELQHYETVRATFEGAAKDKQQQQEPSKAAPRAPSRPRSKGKGKGKAVAGGASDEDEDADRYSSYSVRSKGKGKAVAQFEEGTASDDEGLY